MAPLTDASESATKTKHNAALKNVVLSVFGTLFFLLLIELVAQMVEPDLDWESRQPERSQGAFRTLVLGGSPTAGVPEPSQITRRTYWQLTDSYHPVKCTTQRSGIVL